MSLAISEKEWQSQVLAIAKLWHWEIYHTFDSRRSNAGFPDLVLVKGMRLIFAELKSEKGRVSPAQEKWLALLRCVPRVEVFLWRPSDIEEVSKVLRYS